MPSDQVGTERKRMPVENIASLHTARGPDEDYMELSGGGFSVIIHTEFLEFYTPVLQSSTFYRINCHSENTFLPWKSGSSKAMFLIMLLLHGL